MNSMSFVEAQFRFHYPIQVQVIHEWKCFCMYSTCQSGRKWQNEMSQSLIIAITELPCQCCQNCDDSVISLFKICSKLSVKQSKKSIRANKTETRNVPCTEELNVSFSLMLKTSPPDRCVRRERVYIWTFLFSWSPWVSVSDINPLEYLNRFLPSNISFKRSSKLKEHD